MNRLEYVFYRVEIDGGSYGAVSAPGDGFVDNTALGYYRSDAEVSDRSDSVAKERAYLRWQAVMRAVSDTISPFSVTAIDAAGTPTADDPPGAIAFTLGYDRPEYLRTENIEDDPSGVEVLEGEDAIRRQIARALATNRTENRVIYNPDPPPEPSGQTIAQGPMIEQIEVGALDEDVSSVESAITVTRIENV